MSFFRRHTRSGSKSFAAYVICCLFLISIAFYVSKWKDWGSQATISWDISGYYMYLPGFFYDHLGELNNIPYVINNYHPCGDDFYANRSPLGKYVIKYSSGMAILYLPTFAIGHIWAKLGGYPVDGFSHPYQVSMALYSMVVSFIGLWFIRKVLLRYFEDWAVACTLISLCFATNYLEYSAINGVFSHNYLFTIYAIIILLSILWYEDPDYKKSALLGILCGLSALIRPTEMISVFIPLLWGVGNLYLLRQRVLLLSKHFPKLLLFGFCAFIIGSIQLLYWKKYSGHFIYWSYGPEEGFNFLRVYFHQGLFSYKKGWLTYTPLMSLSLVGLIPLFLYRRGLFWPVIVFGYIATHIAFSWKCWWYGGSFSMRAMVQYYAALSFPLTAFYIWVRNKRVVLFFTVLFVLFCSYLNIIMTYQANGPGIMESDNMSGAYYWAIFGRLHVPREKKKLIDTKEEIPDGLVSSLQTVSSDDSVALNGNNPDTLISGRKLFLVDKRHPFLLEANLAVSNYGTGWFRAHAMVYIDQWEGALNQQPSIYAYFVDENGTEIKRNFYRINRIIDGKQLCDVFIDIQVPSRSLAKNLKAGLYNGASDKIVYCGPVWIEYTAHQ